MLRAGLTYLRDLVAVDIAFTPDVVKATGRDVTSIAAPSSFPGETLTRLASSLRSVVLSFSPT
jgi:hypothetical protein